MMECPDLKFCEQVRDYLNSPEILAGMDAIYSGEKTVEMRYSITDESADLNALEIVIVPGQRTSAPCVRQARTRTAAVGVSIRKHLENDAEIETMSEIAEYIDDVLDDFAPECPAFVKSAELAEKESDNVYTSHEVETGRVFDAIIVMNIRYTKVKKSFRRENVG